MTDRPSTHVLVVDDQSGFRELLKRILEPAGYEVRTAIDATEALSKIVESPPAVAILDVHMPGPNGLWLANQIRTRSPKTAIVLATSDDTVPPTESLRKGVVAYIIKPLQRDSVLTAVSDAFNWFADESRLDLATLGVPMQVEASPDPVLADVAAPVPMTRAPRTVFERLPMKAALFALVLIGAAATALYRQRTPARALDLVAASSGAVSAESASGELLAQGSGFFITPDTFVTNHHVIKGGTRAKVTMATTGQVLQVSGLIGFDRQHDLALLKTSAPAPSHLSLTVALPAVGDGIFVYGAPLGLAGTLSQGIVSAFRAEQDLLQISAPISPGSSGSPVVNSDGAVVAVVAGYRAEGQNLNFAVPAVHVRDLLARASGPSPLVVAARGAGDDRERNQLIGPVQTATVFGAEAYSRTILLFDRSGRLVERRLGDNVTRTMYEYDERGRLKRQLEMEGERTSSRWDFAPAGPNAVEGVISDRGTETRRRVEYTGDGRLLSDETNAAGRLVSSLRWSYDGAGWPAPIRSGAPATSNTEKASSEERDALGNLVRQVLDDGTELRVGYAFDARGNWLSRETTRVDVSGARTVVSRERREIRYW